MDQAQRAGAGTLFYCELSQGNRILGLLDDAAKRAGGLIYAEDLDSREELADIAQVKDQVAVLVGIDDAKPDVEVEVSILIQLAILPERIDWLRETRSVCRLGSKDDGLRVQDAASELELGSFFSEVEFLALHSCKFKHQVLSRVLEDALIAVVQLRQCLLR